MSTETAPNAATDRSTDLVNKLLKLPEQTKLDLAHLLLDSVREGFTRLEEAEKRDKELIHSRLDQLVKGEVQLQIPEEMFAEIRRRVAEVRKQ